MKKSILSLIVFITSLTLLCSCAEEKKQPEPEVAPEHTHAFGAWKQVKEVDCYHDGLKVRTCKCGEVEVELITSFGHRNSAWFGKEPDCDNSGYRSMYCTVCNKLLVDKEYLPPLGHNLVAVETVPPTDNGIGYTRYECSTCGYIRDRDLIEAFGTVHFRYEPVFDTDTCIVLGINDNSNLISVGNDVAELIVPEYIGGYKVVSVADEAFAGNTYLEKIVLPDTVQTIGERAFSGCTSLKEIQIGAFVTDIGNSAFENCSSLVRAELPVTLKNVGIRVFAGCTSLTEMTVPSIMTVIPGEMFKNCTSLKEVSFSDEVTSILDSAFEGCTSLESVPELKSVQYIGKYAFRECEAIKSITFSESIATIGYGAFYRVAALDRVNVPSLETWLDIVFKNGDSNPLNTNAKLYANDSLVKDLVIPADVTVLLDFAFYGYDHLNSVKIPETVTVIGDYIFSYCTSLTKVDISASVDYIGNEFFYGCSSLKNIALPDTVLAICNSAFAHCSAIEEIKLPGKLDAIGANAFKNCVKLSKIDLTSVSAIFNEAFAGCSSLSSVTLSEEIRKIGDSAFADCAVLKAPKLPEGLVYIGDFAFSNCVSFDSVNIPSTLKVLGIGAFCGCENIKTVDIADVDRFASIYFGDIYSNPLYYGAKLSVNGVEPEYLVISVSKVSDFAFWNVDNIDSVYYLGTVEEFKEAVGSGNPFLWNLNIADSVYFYSVTKPATSGNYWYYNNIGNICKW